ncbi:3-methyladenine DNA glycosylase AlkD [Catalinimonas alkaloidigena]|uniref:DNA alkylation repair protein n=1 Tax=Catalinimonas alkaloidigena TaxID=1075417 RepID=UPI002405653C|nr:DNA alkylation repair protein [Catalinimonas alkaloidigena]MDF9799387.1 3-methyladenine DNA glycosylase AlkD [Catalinimonas alkaloidigena]
MANMKLSSKAAHILGQINHDTKLGDLRKIAKEIKKDHALAMELWSTGEVLPRLLAILVFDNKLLSSDLLNKLDQDIQTHTSDKRNQLMDWLMANQLTKSREKIELMESWENSPSSLQRRAYWYYQGRLRWTGQTPPDNTAVLLSKIEAEITDEEPEVQWAMNFVAGWIGVFDEKYRSRCIKLGEKTGLYKGEMVSKGCTPNYLPEFITIEANKRNL